MTNLRISWDCSQKCSGGQTIECASLVEALLEAEKRGMTEWSFNSDDNCLEAESKDRDTRAFIEL